ncbi:MAG TPA: TonB family protein [Flavisolibacter sp.]|nr:TonB family protein [Flavisolibacter sp.]
MRSWLCAYLLLPLLSFSQKKDTLFKYLDSTLQPTNGKNAAYFGVAIKDGKSWMLYALYPDTTLVIKAWFKDRQLQIKDGPYTLYYPKRMVAQAGYYKENKMNGIWQTWHSNGQKKDSGLIKNNLLTGLWKEWYPSGRLKFECTYQENSAYTVKSVSNAYYGIKNGGFTSWYEDGTMESNGTYTNDIMEGEWKFYHTNGTPSTVEQYKYGKVVSLLCFDTTGKGTGEFCSIDKPALLKGFGNYQQYIYQNLLWPQEAIQNNIEGEVRVRFAVNKFGQLEKLVIESDKEVLKKAVEELFETMKEWYPAVSHNRNIDWEEQITIPFYRNK